MLHQEAPQVQAVGTKEGASADVTATRHHEDAANRFEAIRTCASGLFQQQTRDLTKTTELTRTVQAQTQVEQELKQRHRALQQLIASMEARKQIVAEQNKERTELLRTLDQEVSGVAESQQKLQHCLSRADSVAQAVERFVNQFSTAPDAWPPVFLTEALAITRGVTAGDFRNAATEMRRLKCAADLVERQLEGQKLQRVATEDDQRDHHVMPDDGRSTSAAESLRKARAAVSALCDAIHGAVSQLRVALGRPGGDSSVAAVLDDRGTISLLDKIAESLRTARAMGVEEESIDSTTPERLEPAIAQLHGLLRSPKPLEGEWRCACQQVLETLMSISAQRREAVLLCAATTEGGELPSANSAAASASLADSELALRNLWREYEAQANQLSLEMREHADSVGLVEVSRHELDLVERWLGSAQQLLSEAKDQRDNVATAVLEARQKVQHQQTEVKVLTESLTHSQELLRLLGSDSQCSGERAARTLDDAWDDYCSRVEVVRKLSFDVATEEQNGAAQLEALNALERAAENTQGVVSAVRADSVSMKAEIDGALCVLSSAVSQWRAGDNTSARASLEQMMAAAQSLSCCGATYAARDTQQPHTDNVHDAVGTVRQHVLAGAVSSLCCDGVAPLITDPELRTRLAAGVHVVRSARQMCDEAVDRARKTAASLADRSRRLEELVQC